MEETPITIIGILIAFILMLVVPLISLADKSDDVSQLVIQTVTAEFVDEVIKTGKITYSEYSKFLDQLASTGNTYDVDIELKILDENTAKYYADSDNSKISNNTYYSLFTSQIEDMLYLSELSTGENHTDGKIVLKQGDSIFVTVSNDSQTLSQSLKSFYSGSKGNDIKIITATASGTVAISGTR